MESKLIILIVIVGLGAIPSISVSAHADNCYADGHADGRDHPFSQTKFTKCGDQYERGFMAGCLSVMGNDKEVCNLAEDAGQ